MGGSMYITATSKICHSTDKIFKVIHTAEKQLNWMPWIIKCYMLGCWMVL